VRFEATWTFEALGERTRLTGRMRFASAAERNTVVKEYNAIEGGNQTLDRLTAYLGAALTIRRRKHRPTRVVLGETLNS
jgi:hypothetical protein